MNDLSVHREGNPIYNIVYSDNFDRLPGFDR